MAVTQKAKDAYAKYKTFKKAKDYYKTVKNVIDEDTRSAEIFKQGLKLLMKLGEKAIGAPLTKHPYFAFHKVHLEMLGKALTASDTHAHAMEALHKAIAAADSAEAITKQLDALNHRKNALKPKYMFFMASGLDLIADVRAGKPAALKELADTGTNAQELATALEEMLYAWRAEICEIYLDVMELLAMVEVEYKAASAAYRKYQEKVKKLTESKNSMDRVAGLAAERKRQYEWLDRVMDEGKSGGPKASADAVVDPSKFAERQRDTVDEVAQKLLTMCDVAMSEDAYKPMVVNRELGSL